MIKDQFIVTLLLFIFSVSTHASSVSKENSALEHIKHIGYVTCGISGTMPGFAVANGKTSQGMEIDFCRMLSAAIFGKADKVKFIPLTSVDEFLQDPSIDIALHALTWTFSREMGASLHFGPVMFYDGQAFLLPKKLGIASVKQLAQRPICYLSTSEALNGLEQYFRRHQLALEVMPVDTQEHGIATLQSGQCVAYTADASRLAAIQLTNPAAQQYQISSETISQEPLAPILHRGDDHFFDIVRWSFYATVEAETLGISSTNIDQFLSMNQDAEVSTFLHPHSPHDSGLDPRWTYNIIKEVGNYGEIFNRNIGTNSAAKLPRSLNRPWTDGGILYAPPFR